MKRLAETCFICQPSVFMRAGALVEVGGLDVNLQASMDYDLWIKFGKKFAGKIAFIEDYIATSRMYPENKTSSIRERVRRENLALLQKHFGYVEGVHVASCLYDIYENLGKIPFIESLKIFLRRLFFIRYLLNVKTLFSFIGFIAENIWKIRFRNS
jgi:hypothetical protein